VAALGLPVGEVPPVDAARVCAVAKALHGTAAEALATALPLPPGGLVLELGGQGIYAAALLRRHERLHAALVDAAPGPAAASSSWPAGEAGRVRALAALEALGDERAAAAVLAQTTRTLSLGALRTRLGRVVGYVAAEAPVAVVGPFRGGAGGRPRAPLLALLELAAGGPGWCPTVGQVADAIVAGGFAAPRILLLPEPAVALVTRLV
jgi:hypothetical protein